jgi:hypothetical protein
MKAWKIDHLGGELKFVDVSVPEVRPGSVLVRVEAQSLPIPVAAANICGQFVVKHRCRALRRVHPRCALLPRSRFP